MQHLVQRWITKALSEFDKWELCESKLSLLHYLATGIDFYVSHNLAVRQERVIDSYHLASIFHADIGWTVWLELLIGKAALDPSLI